MDNFFILLELPFDPAENNESVINTAINNKINQWQNESKNPKKTILAKEKLSMIPEIKKVMLNPSLRIKEAQKALSIKEKMLQDLKYDILIKSSKGNITIDEKKELEEKYKKYGIDSNLINIKIEEITGDNIELNITDKTTISQLETYFKNLEIDDMSLYEFLKVDKNSNLNVLNNKTEKELQFLLQKGNKTTSDEMKQKILGISKKIFSSAEEKKKYDNYLKGFRFYKLNLLIQDGARTNNIINENLYYILFDIASERYDMSSKNFSLYLKNNCFINNIEIEQNVKNIINSNIKENTQNISLETNKKNKNIQNQKPVVQEIPEKENITNTLDYEKLTQSVADRLNELHNSMQKNINEVNFYETEYYKYDRLPTKSGIIIYLIVLSLLLFANIVVFISFYKTMNSIIKNFILISSIVALIEGGYFIYNLKKLNAYLHNKNTMLFYFSKFNKIANEKYNKVDFSISQIEEYPDSVLEYFDKFLKDVEKLSKNVYEYSRYSLNGLASFNKVPKQGNILFARIIFVFFITVLFYGIIFYFFPNFL